MFAWYCRGVAPFEALLLLSTCLHIKAKGTAKATSPKTSYSVTFREYSFAL